MQELVDDPGPGQRLKVQARLAELDAETLDLADGEPLADQVVQAHAAGHDLTARLRAAEADVLEHLGFDQRDRIAGAPPVAEVPVALEPLPGNSANGLDGAERVGVPDRDRVDLHATS